MFKNLISAPGKAVLIALCLLAVTGCTRPDETVSRGAYFDPYEEQNRRNHGFNKSVDTALLRPVSKGYGQVAPIWLQTGIGNFVRNLGQPRVILNNILQGDLENAGRNTLRFALNTTFGVGGIFDPATEAEIPIQTTDFGETLHVWGAPEGAYLEIPFLGPSTERDAVGRIANFVIDPLSWVLPADAGYVRVTARGADFLGERDRRSETVDSILYGSEDSYAQTRLIYLQNRAFALGRDSADSFDDPYGSSETPGADPYFDPYEDPHAQ